MYTIADATPRVLSPLRIVLPGGSGQVGQALARHFTERGHQVTVLTRGPYTASWQTVHWDGENIGSWTEYLEGADVCINLAGRSVNCRYDAANRQAIYESRIGSTRPLQLTDVAKATSSTPVSKAATAPSNQSPLPSSCTLLRMQRTLMMSPSRSK